MSDLASSTRRRYRFRDHGRSECRRHWQRRQRNRQQQRRDVYRALQGQQPNFEQIIDHENLLLAYDKLRAEGGPAPGIDGLTYGDLSRSEIARALQAAAQAIRDGRYRPYPTRLVQIPKGNGRYRELRLATIVDRTIAKALQEAITPTLDPIFGETVFGFRPAGGTGDTQRAHDAQRGRNPQDRDAQQAQDQHRAQAPQQDSDVQRARGPQQGRDAQRAHDLQQDRGVRAMLLAIERTAIEQDRWVIAQDDIRDAFPSVPLDDVLADFRRHITNNSVRRLIEAVLRGHEGPARTKGLDQGNAASPVALLLRLHHALGLPLNAAGTGHPLWHAEYADNLVFVCKSVSEGHQALDRTRDLLQAAGFALKGEDGPPVNLKRQGAHVEVLGFRVTYGNGRLRYGLGRKAWGSLDRNLGEAHELADTRGAARAAVRGWLAAHGPAFESEVEDGEVLRGIRETGSCHGFRETGGDAELLGWLRIGRQQWLAARERALGAVCRHIGPM